MTAVAPELHLERNEATGPSGRTGGAALDDRADRRWRIAAFCVIAAVSALMLATFMRYGLTWDEEFQAEYGEIALGWYTSLLRDRTALIDIARLRGGVDHFYGAAFDLVAQAATRVSPLGTYETRHLLNVLVAIASVLATYRMAALLGGARSGLMAAILLVATPAYYGHAFNNPKDIPFAALHAWVLVLALETAASVPRVPWWRVTALGAVAGLALGVRIGGAFIIGYAVLAWAAVLLPRGREPGFARGVLAPAAIRIVAIVGIAWLVLLLSWPGAQVRPFTRPLEALADLGRTGTVLPVLFDGRIVRSDALPRSYLPTWLAITLPELWLVALAACVASAGRALWVGLDRLRAIRVGVLAVAVLFPVSFSVVAQPNMFDAWRHFLFIAPPMAALLGHGFACLTAERTWPFPARAAVVIAAVAALALVLVDMVRLHPYEAVYFNRLVAGGLPGAHRRFETDYWGASHREGIEWLLSLDPAPDRSTPVRVANCSQAFLTAYPLSRDPRGASFVNVEMREAPEIVLATTRHGCAARLAEAGWRPLHAVERMGVPLLYVLAAPGR